MIKKPEQARQSMRQTPTRISTRNQGMQRGNRELNNQATQHDRHDRQGALS